jgi:hypothetical protein
MGANDKCNMPRPLVNQRAVACLPLHSAFVKVPRALTSRGGKRTAKPNKKSARRLARPIGPLQVRQLARFYGGIRQRFSYRARPKRAERRHVMAPDWLCQAATFLTTSDCYSDHETNYLRSGRSSQP